MATSQVRGGGGVRGLGGSGGWGGGVGGWGIWGQGVGGSGGWGQGGWGVGGWGLGGWGGGVRGVGWWSKYAFCFVCAVPACHDPCFCRLVSTPAFFPVPPPRSGGVGQRVGRLTRQRGGGAVEKERGGVVMRGRVRRQWEGEGGVGHKRVGRL